MEIRLQPQSQNFTSRVNPIKVFKVKTSRGNLTFQEPSLAEIRNKAFLKKLAKFFCDNFASNSEEPGWLAYKNGDNPHIAATIFESCLSQYKAKLLNPKGDLTLLVAKDRFNNIRGACLAFGYDDVPNAEKSVYYIDSLAVNPRFRGYNIGRILLAKTLESVQNKFSDVFLIGENMALGFYKKLGFKHLNSNDAVQKTVIDFVAQDNFCYPKYVSFLTKPLKIHEPRWYVETAKAIEKLGMNLE